MSSCVYMSWLIAPTLSPPPTCNGPTHTHTQAWEEITIAEEAESGKQVSSVIRVPAQVDPMCK